LKEILKKVLRHLRDYYKLVFKPKLGLQKTDKLINLKGQEVSDLIIQMVNSNKPFLISRFGSEELKWYVNYKQLKNNIFTRFYYYITCKSEYWEKKYQIIDNLTFKPKSLPMTDFFIDKMDSAIPNIDLLGSWLDLEMSKFVRLKAKSFCFLFDLEPYFHDVPWTLALKDKKVLVIHPMESEIISQFKKRTKLFSKEVLPVFNLITLKSLYFDHEKYNTWELIYNYYVDEINKIDFDIALVSCGPWGMPIASYVKSIGKQAIHLGGAQQILFGIMGNRWREWPEYKGLQNEFWIDNVENKPKWAYKYENGCYW
jgi:hypothetical protein